jgi:hypothetical protein
MNDQLFPGQGYFIKVSDACSFSMIGHDFPSSKIGYLGSSQIKAGESLIGAPTQSASVASIKGSCSLNGNPLMFLYDATSCSGVPFHSGESQCGTASAGYNYCYCGVTTLLPGYGYNIYANSQCSFV